MIYRCSTLATLIQPSKVSNSGIQVKSTAHEFTSTEVAPTGEPAIKSKDNKFKLKSEHLQTDVEAGIGRSLGRQTCRLSGARVRTPPQHLSHPMCRARSSRPYSGGYWQSTLYPNTVSATTGAPKTCAGSKSGGRRRWRSGRSAGSCGRR